MSTSPCREPLSLIELMQYWVREIPESLQMAMEAHLFECASCNVTLEGLVSLGEGVRAIAQRGGVAAILTRGFAQKLKADGAQIREYRLEPGDSVSCTIAPDDDFAIAHVHAPLAGVQRLDVLFVDADRGLPYRFNDVAFNAEDGEIVLAPKASDLRSLGVVTQRVRLVSVADTGERTIGEYFFHHSPHRAP
jgi:hypothetical protein